MNFASQSFTKMMIFGLLYDEEKGNVGVQERVQEDSDIIKLQETERREIICNSQ
jgi:hypothetical protein